MKKYLAWAYLPGALLVGNFTGKVIVVVGGALITQLLIGILLLLVGWFFTGVLAGEAKR